MQQLANGESGEMPGLKPGLTPPADDSDNGSGGGGGGGPDLGLDPIIMGLLARLPKAGEGWSEASRDLWLDLMKNSFKLIYRDESEQ